MFNSLTSKARLAAPLVGAAALIFTSAAVVGAQSTDPASLRIRGGEASCDAGQISTTLIFERGDGDDDTTITITEAESEAEPNAGGDVITSDLEFDPSVLPAGTDSAEAVLTGPVDSTITASVTFEVSGPGISVPEEFLAQTVVTAGNPCETPPSTVAPTTTKVDTTTVDSSTTAPSSTNDTVPAPKQPVASPKTLSPKFTG